MSDTTLQAALRAAFNSKLSVIQQTLTPEQQTQARTNIGAISSNDLNQQVKNAVLSMFFPVGSIYLSASDSFNPNDSWGGTWEKIENRFLLGSSASKAVGATGGEENVTLTVGQIPAHSHSGSTGSAGNHSHTRNTMNIVGSVTFNGGPWDSPGSGAISMTNVHTKDSGGGGGDGQQLNFNAANSWSGQTSTNGSHTHTVKIDNTGSGLGHNNMPPYEVVIIWKRTA